MNGIPEHSVVIRPGLLLAEIDLEVDGRVVSSTTAAADVTQESDAVKRLVHFYFHMPLEPKE